MMDPVLVAVGASVLSAGLTGLVSSVITTRSLTAVMDQKVSDVTRRVGVLETVKLDTAVASVQHAAIADKVVDLADGLGQRIDAALQEISRERHRVNNLVQGTKPQG